MSGNFSGVKMSIFASPSGLIDQNVLIGPNRGRDDV